MKTINIPNYANLEIKNLVLDYNGTIATNGKIEDETKHYLHLVSKEYKTYVITADTFGSVAKELEEFSIEVKILKSSNHTNEKADFIKSLGAKSTVAIGNGNNDAKMLKEAIVSIGIIGNEGCSISALQSSDVVCTNIVSALILLLNTKSLIATLRQ